MTGGQEKNFSTLGPKLRENRAQQYYGDKQRQICFEVIDYETSSFLPSIMGKTTGITLHLSDSVLHNRTVTIYWVLASLYLLTDFDVNSPLCK